MSSLVVLVSVVLGYVRWEIFLFGIIVDQIAAGFIVIFIAHAGWELLSDGMRVLLDASIDFETLDQVKKILEDHPMVLKVQALIGRNVSELVRQIQAFQHVRTTNGAEATPSGWVPGKPTLKPGPDLVGRIWEVWKVENAF